MRKQRQLQHNWGTAKLLCLLAFFSAAMGSGVGTAGAAESRPVKELALGSGIAATSTADLPTLLKSGLGLDTDAAFTVRATTTLPNNAGQTVRLDQTYRGVPVWGQQVVVQLSQSNSVAHVGGTAVFDIATTTAAPTPALAPADAMQRVKQAVSTQTSIVRTMNYENEENKLFYYLEQGGTLRLVYRVSFYTDLTDSNGGLKPTRPVHFIDANTGATVHSFDNIQHTALGTGPGGNAKTGQYNFGTGSIPKIEVTQSGTTCTLNSTYVLSENLNNLVSNGSQTPFSFTCPNNTFKSINGAYSPLNDAQSFGNALYSMYQSWYGTPPITQKLWMKVHYGSSYQNAFWNGNSMTFGDGASVLYPLVGLDVTGHEVAHGFTEQHSNLIYSGQSGGINEAYSDMAGEALEYYWSQTYGSLFGRAMPDYNVGAEIFKATGQSLRYMCNPTQDGSSIDNAANYYNGLDVHYSSGVFNKAYCLLAKSANWNPKKAFDVFTLANQSYWTPSSTFQTGADGVLQATLVLGYPALDVINAFGQVGITIGGGTKAVVTAPAQGTTLSGGTTAFSWDTGTNVTEYWLYVGTTGAGTFNIFNQSTGTTRSATVTSIPTSGTVYVRLWSKISGVWQFGDSTYTGGPLGAKAVMTTPTPGTALSGSAVSFGWTAGSSVGEYWLYVGTTGVGSANIYNSTTGTGQSVTVPGLPASGSVYVRLWSKLGTTWAYNDYTYGGYGTLPAVVNSPANGSTILGTVATFGWTAGVGVSQYWIYVGSTGVGSMNILNTSMGTNRTASVSGLPTSGTIFVRMWSSIVGVWSYTDTAYTASGSDIAVMTAPTPGSALSGTSAAFGWSAGTSVSQYWLYVGTAGAGTSNLYNQSQGTGRSVTVSGLPVVGTVYVRIWSLIGSGWQFSDQSYTGSGGAPSVMLSPANGSTVTPVQTFTWSAGTGVTQYWLYFGRAQGGYEMFNGSLGANTSATFSTFPNDSRAFYVRLWSLNGAVWSYNDYTYKDPAVAGSGVVGGSQVKLEQLTQLQTR
jgi:vibriolysin